MRNGERIFSLSPNEGEARFLLGDVVTFKITAAESDNYYFLTEIISMPGGGPALLVPSNEPFT